MTQRFKVIAHLPTSVELTKRTTKNALKVNVRIGDHKEGTLMIARGSVEWWPDHNKVNAHRVNWEKFAEMMEDVPRRRSSRKRPSHQLDSN